MSNKKNMSIKSRRVYATEQELDQDVQLYVKWHSTGRTQLTTFPFSTSFLTDVGTKIKQANEGKCDVHIITKDKITKL